MRAIPGLCGVSVESVASLLKFLTARELVIIDSIDGSRMKTARLSEAGVTARHQHDELVETVERRWCGRFGASNMTSLRAALLRVLDHRSDGRPTTADGLKPHPGGWRSRPP